MRGRYGQPMCGFRSLRESAFNDVSDIAVLARLCERPAVSAFIDRHGLPPLDLSKPWPVRRLRQIGQWNDDLSTEAIDKTVRRHAAPKV